MWARPRAARDRVGKLLRRSHDRLLDRVRRRGAALRDLALRELGGLVDGLHRNRRRVDLWEIKSQLRALALVSDEADEPFLPLAAMYCV